MSEHPMEQYLAEEAAKPGPTMTITKASYLFLLEQLRAMERSAGAAAFVWERLEGTPGFNEELRQAQADLEAGKGTPFKDIQRSAGAAPLDVERLAAAMAVNGISDGDGLPLFDIAERITAEYARLSERTDR